MELKGVRQLKPRLLRTAGILSAVALACAATVLTYRYRAARQTPEYALAVQAERNWNHPRYPQWSASYGQIIEAANANGTLSAAQWQRYAREAVDFGLDVRGPVRRGDPIPVRLSLSTRLGPEARFRIEYRESYELRGGIRLPTTRGVNSQVIASGTMGDTPWIMLSPDAAARSKLADGPQYLRASVDVRVFDDDREPGAPLAERRILLGESYTQCAPTQATRGLSYGAPGRDMLRTGLRLNGVTVGKWIPGKATLTFDPPDLAEPINASIVARDGLREWEVTRGVQFRPGAKHLIEWRPLELDVDRVDVVIRPAEADLDPHRVSPPDIGQYELVLRDVPLQRHEGTTKPASGR